MTSFFHEGWELTSRPSGYNVAGVDTTARMYACENIATAVNVVHADRNTPGFQRAPAETPYMFGLECAMDELAYALAMDPIELRRVNDTQIDPVSGTEVLLPLADASVSTRRRRRFGWKSRNPKPGFHARGRLADRLWLRQRPAIPPTSARARRGWR